MRYWAVFLVFFVGLLPALATGDDAITIRDERGSVIERWERPQVGDRDIYICRDERGCRLGTVERDRWSGFKFRDNRGTRSDPPSWMRED